MRLLEVSKKSALGKAIRYALKHWEGLMRFIDDGRIERKTICSPVVKAPTRHGPFSRRSSTRQNFTTSTRGTILVTFSSASYPNAPR
ncbi:IS66 family transposase [Bradyrhizobium sp. UFLA03-84]|uniref:IS66 family transposase n=1 Tax=Bradyrhizobium sp. UFLA03-84 TaxID=418599 RepID=UPI001FDAAD24|nr:IS66 family transposase [Bradyrhizobium sp. UFLA03-84]